MVKVYRYYHSEEGKGKTKQTLHCFKSLLAIYFPLIIFCTSNYPMSCSFVSRQKNLLGEKSGDVAAIRTEVFKEREQEDVDPV